MAAFGPQFWNSPLVSQVAFVPRKTPRNADRDDEGVVSVGDAELGWRLYVRPVAGAASDPVVFYLHANAETAADVLLLAPTLFEAGAAAVFALDYRGYGWSTGTPSFGTLLSDVELVSAALPAILTRFALGDRPLVAYGRSLGAAAAVHVASTLPVRCPAVSRHLSVQAGDVRHRSSPRSFCSVQPSVGTDRHNAMLI